VRQAPESARPAAVPRWVVVLSAVVVLSTILPHIHQAATTPPGWRFTGVVEAVDDQNLYFSWLEQMRDGRLLVYDYETAEEGPPFLPNPPWLIIGLLARVIPLPLIVTYHAVRLVWGFGCLLVVWLLVREFFERPLPRMFAFVTAALGSGLGALADGVNAIAGRTVLVSADLMPEMWGYHSLSLPNFVMAIALMALLALILLRAYRRPSLRLSLAAMATMFVLTLTHAYNVGVLAPLLVGHFVFCRIARPDGGRNAGINLWALAGIVPAAAFLWWQTHANPLVASWGEQNVLRSPPPLVYLLGFGVVLPLAIAGRIALGRRRRETAADWLMIFWVPVTLVAIYSYPVLPFERRCVEGVFLPLAILTGIAMGDRLVPLLRARLQGGGERGAIALAMALLLAGILPTNVKLLVDGALSDEPLIPPGWVAGFAWVTENTPPDARFFTSQRTGGLLARYALRHVHVGHWNLTVDVERKREMARRFFTADTPDAERLAILRASGCGWVAATAGQAAGLEGWDALKIAHDAGDLLVFRFRESPPPPRLSD